jgi:hypothetical protein
MQSFDIHTFAWLAFLAPLGLFWQQVRSFVLRLLGILIKTRMIEDYTFSEVYYVYLHDKYPWYRTDNYKIARNGAQSKEYKCMVEAYLKLPTTEIILYKYFIPVIVRGRKNRGVQIIYFKWTFPFENLFRILDRDYVASRMDASKKRQELNGTGRDRFEIITESGSLGQKSDGPMSYADKAIRDKAESVSEQNKTDEDAAIFGTYSAINRRDTWCSLGWDVLDYEYCSANPEKDRFQETPVAKKVFNQLNTWIRAKQWYGERNIPWRIGYMFYGDPGNGKSTLAVEIAKRLQISLTVFNLPSMTDYDFIRACQRDACNNEVGVVLFEDIDTVFEKRKNVNDTSMQHGVTFQCFSNKLSGAEGIRNRIIIMTANNLSQIDPALLRKGRIDEQLFIGPLTQAEKAKFAATIFDDAETIQRVVNEGVDDTTAAFEYRCTSEALNQFWKNKHVDNL